MSIPTLDLVTKLDFSDPSCYSGSGNTVYDLVSNNDFNIVNSPTFVSDGAKSYFQFTASSNKLQVITPVDVSSQTVFTFSAWAYNTGGSVAVQVLFGSGQNVGSGGVPHIALNVSEANGVISSFGYGVGTAVGTTINQNQWYLLTMTCDGTTNKLYINDTLVGSASQSTGSIYNDPTNFVIGQYSDVENSIPWIGRVGAYYYYDAALTAGEVANLYNDTAPRFDNLVARYDLNNSSSYPGTGNTLFDLSENNYDVALTSTTYNTYTGYNTLEFLKGSSSKGTFTGDMGLGTTNPNFTFFMWVNPIDLVSGVSYGWFLSYGAESAPIGGAPMILGEYAGSPNLSISFGSGIGLYNSGIGLTIGDWACLAFTCDGTNNKLYLNGSLLGTVSKGASQINTPQELAINYLAQTGVGYISYELNYLDIYDTALTSGEITQLYNDTVGRFTPAPPAYQGIVGGRQFAQGFNG